MEITKTTEIVKRLLEQHSFLRDDDERLIGNVWANDLAKLNLDPDLATARDFLRHFAAGNLTNPESIRRSRARLQQLHPELRGQKYAERHKHQEQVRQDLGYKG